jgi:transposase
MKAYSLDLRQKIVSAYELGVGSQRELAKTFGVSRPFVERLLRRHKTTGDIAPRPHGGGQRPRLDESALQVLRQLVTEYPDATLQELRQTLYEQQGIQVSTATMCIYLKRMDLPRKKVHSRL